MALKKELEIGNTGIAPDYHVLFHFQANDFKKHLKVETIAWLDQAARDAEKGPTNKRVTKEIGGEEYDALMDSPVPEGATTIRDVFKIAGYMTMKQGTDLEDAEDC